MGLWEILKGEQPGYLKLWLNAENNGDAGEYLTEYALTNDNLAGELVVLKNIYIPLDDSKTTEIDLIMLHEKGLFVFESKNYSGWIFGSDDQLYWTQSLPNKTKNKFYNPIRQNQKHIQALAEYLHRSIEEFTSYIVFSERCTLKEVPNDTERVIIVRRPDMLKKLRKTFKDTQIKYSHEELQDMAEKLKPLTNKTEEEKQQHIDNIKTKCPFCGSELVLREGKHGKFWGCKAYPKCKFTRKE